MVVVDLEDIGTAAEDMSACTEVGIEVVHCQMTVSGEVKRLAGNL